MKKLLIGLSGILVAAFVIIMFTNAQNNQQDVKKPATATTAASAKCPSAAACPMAMAKTAEVKACDPARCKEMGCDPAKSKEAKCDPAKCKANLSSTSGSVKKCDPAMCPMAAKK